MSISSLLQPPLLSWLVTAVVGRILIYVWQKFPTRYVPTNFVKDIHACDLCSGVYLYSAAFLFSGYGLVASFVLGVVTSFIVWVFMKGMKTLIAPETLIIK
jgi:hypothetical protein